jgi:UDP-3-O-[3-hydroxymyristoyl] glucosamine N-acyltransferase
LEFRNSIRRLIRDLGREMREKFRRHVSVGDLLTDRWEIARDYWFGEGTSCYDNVLILGDVEVGKHCWIGPNVILDGQGGLTIGDHCDISAVPKSTLTTPSLGVLAVEFPPLIVHLLRSARASISARNALSRRV